MSNRVKAIIVACLVMSYFFVDGLAMSRYQRLHNTIDCDALPEYTSRYDCRRGNHTTDVKAVWAGMVWPVYLVVSFGIELGDSQ